MDDEILCRYVISIITGGDVPKIDWSELPIFPISVGTSDSRRCALASA